MTLIAANDRDRGQRRRERCFESRFCREIGQARSASASFERHFPDAFERLAPRTPEALQLLAGGRFAIGLEADDGDRHHAIESESFGTEDVLGIAARAFVVVHVVPGSARKGFALEIEIAGRGARRLDSDFRRHEMAHEGIPPNLVSAPATGFAIAPAIRTPKREADVRVRLDPHQHLVGSQHRRRAAVIKWSLASLSGVAVSPHTMHTCSLATPGSPTRWRRTVTVGVMKLKPRNFSEPPARCAGMRRQSLPYV